MAQWTVFSLRNIYDDEPIRRGTFNDYDAAIERRNRLQEFTSLYDCWVEEYSPRF